MSDETTPIYDQTAATVDYGPPAEAEQPAPEAQPAEDDKTFADVADDDGSDDE